MAILRAIWKRWKLVLKVVANFQGRVFFTLFYFIFVSPIAMAVKIFSDPLGIKKRASSYWRPVKEVSDKAGEARRQ